MMDEFLSQVYGTGELVKQASDQNQAVQELYGAFEGTVDALVKEGQIDPSQLTEQDMAEMFEGFVEKVAEDAEAQEKYASLSKEAWDQADSMGRIMAHSYVDEMSKLGKDTEETWRQYADRTKAQERAAQYEKGAPSVAGKGYSGATTPTAGEVSKGAKGAKGAGEKAPGVFRRFGRFAKGEGKTLGKAIGETWGRTGGKAALIGVPLAGAAALGGGAYAGKKYLGGKKKAASLGIPEEIVYEQAYELLKNAGWTFDTGEVMPPEYGMQLMKQAEEGESEEEKKKREEEAGKGGEGEKEAALNAAALEHLAEAGYPINE